MHIKLANSSKKVKVCRRGFALLKKNNMAEGWRLHSAGYAVVQFTRFGKIHTVYMHKLFAEKFLEKPPSDKKLFVRVINGKKLDCRIDNLEWVTMSGLRRQQHSNEGYRGVSQDGNKYRAVLYDGGDRVYLGMFDTEEEAATAYDKESYRRFGFTESLNFKQLYELHENEA